MQLCRSKHMMYYFRLDIVYNKHFSLNGNSIYHYLSFILSGTGGGKNLWTTCLFPEHKCLSEWATFTENSWLQRVFIVKKTKIKLIIGSKPTFKPNVYWFQNSKRFSKTLKSLEHRYDDLFLVIFIVVKCALRFTV